MEWRVRWLGHGDGLFQVEQRLKCQGQYHGLPWGAPAQLMLAGSRVAFGREDDPLLKAELRHRLDARAVGGGRGNAERTPFLWVGGRPGEELAEGGVTSVLDQGLPAIVRARPKDAVISDSSR